jgi:hypothetical protein
MRSDIHYWQSIIISEKYIQPITKEEQANYDIAQYLLFRGKNENG